MPRTQRHRYDAIVVGSGITGGWAAKDYTEHIQAWQLPFRGYGDRRHSEATQPIQKNCYACDEWGSKFFVNDIENPYTFDADKPFHWIRGRHVGGRSITWGRQVYRWSDLDFEANLKDGHGVDWPIRYADIAPWYSYVEKFIGITGLSRRGSASTRWGTYMALTARAVAHAVDLINRGEL